MDIDDATGADASGRRLDRATILDAALRFADERSVRELTMRRLGGVLGVEAMSLYRYVPSRADLLDALVDHVLDEVAADRDVLERPEHGWQDFLQRLAHAVRHVALAHPNAFPLVASQPPQAPWLRPPLRSLRWAELLLDGLVSEGFDDVQAAQAYRVFTSFLLGYLLLETANVGADIADTDPEGEDVQHPPGALADHPTLQRLRDELARPVPDTEFDDALEDALQRIELLRRS